MRGGGNFWQKTMKKFWSIVKMLSPTRFCNICQILPPPLFKERGGNFWQKHGKQNTDFTFEYVKKKCKEYGVCDFVTRCANRGESLSNPDIVYRKKYLQIKLL